MILTCPQCATRYFLPDGQVGRAGRAVKCTQCGAVWRAAPEPGAEPAPAAPAPAPEPPPVAAFEPEEDDVSPAAYRRAEILRERKAEAERKAREATVRTVAVWAGLAAAVALLLVLAGIFRIQVVKMWPGAASAYAALGVPVNASGLLIDKVQAAPSVKGGRRVLTVTGVLTNASAAPRPTPAFRVSVLDAAGQPLVQRVIAVPAVALRVGEARRFELQVTDPPAGAKDVEVTLALPPEAREPSR